MYPDLIASEAIIPWIKLHRTHLKDKPDVMQAYVAELQNDYRTIQSHLPAVNEVTSILDIGCGLAGIDILLQRHYPNAKLFLLDGDGPPSDWGAGWNSHFKPFNSMKTTCEFLALNGVSPDRVYPVDTQEPLEADLVVSFLSWGFHYSLFKYRVKTPCAIATIRKGVGQVDALFTQSEYRGRQIGKEHGVIDSIDKYNLMKFSFDNVTAVR